MKWEMLKNSSTDFEYTRGVIQKIKIGKKDYGKMKRKSNRVTVK